MAEGSRPAQVTRREFYVAQGGIWFFIMLIAGDLWRMEERWTTSLLCVAATLMTFTYAVLSLRAGRASQGSGTSAEPGAAPDRRGM